MEQAPDEGVIKFHCEHIIAQALPGEDVAELKHFRQLLYMQKLIGEDENGIGYGNISTRILHTDRFIISGTQTGHLQQLQPQHFVTVNNYDIAGNKLQCIGPVKASSESLTHAAIYSVSKNINAVIHVHHAGTWQKYLNKLPTTSAKIPYGSPEIAFAIMKLYDPENQIVMMAGHKDGIISYGENLASAYKNLMEIIIS